MFGTAPTFPAMTQNRIRIKKNVLLPPPVKEQVDRRWTAMGMGTSYSEALVDLIERGLKDWQREQAQQPAA
jgi:hypothetical protein